MYERLRQDPVKDTVSKPWLSKILGPRLATVAETSPIFITSHGNERTTVRDAAPARLRGVSHCYGAATDIGQ